MGLGVSHRSSVGGAGPRVRPARGHDEGVSRRLRGRALDRPRRGRPAARPGGPGAADAGAGRVAHRRRVPLPGHRGTRPRRAPGPRRDESRAATGRSSSPRSSRCSATDRRCAPPRVPRSRATSASRTTATTCSARGSILPTSTRSPIPSWTRSWRRAAPTTSASGSPRCTRRRRRSRRRHPTLARRPAGRGRHRPGRRSGSRLTRGSAGTTVDNRLFCRRASCPTRATAGSQ